MKTALTEEQENDVEQIMNLALDWLMAWDVVDEGKNPAPEKDRIAAMHRLKEGVIGLACRAAPNVEHNRRPQGVRVDGPVGQK